MSFLLIIVIVAAIVWRISYSKLPAHKVNLGNAQQPESAETRHLKDALQFAKAQHRSASDKQREQMQWEKRYGETKVAELDKLNGIEFEEFLAGLFRTQGYETELTATTGDYGADILLSKDSRRVAVQAKRYIGSVGVTAVQEALAGKAYYHCTDAWVVTTGNFTANALELANRSSVRLVTRSELGKLMVDIGGSNGN